MNRFSYLLSFFLIVAPFFTSLTAQPHTNEGFESWEDRTHFKQPVSWDDNNLSGVLFGSGSVLVQQTTESKAGNSALKLTTDTSDGFGLSGEVHLKETGSSNRGLSYTEQADSIIFHAKYDIDPNDSAEVSCRFSKNGPVINSGKMVLKGKANNYQRFSIPFDWSGISTKPDTLKITITSSSASLFTGDNSVIIDDLRAKGASMKSIPNGSFEQWQDFATEEVSGWGSFNLFHEFALNQSSVSKVSNSRSGNYAVQIQSLQFFTDTFGVFFNIPYERLANENQTPGVAINGKPETISFYYKYQPTGTDTARALYNITGYDQNADSTITVAQDSVLLFAENSYTEKTLNVNYQTTLTPDTFFLAFSSSNSAFGDGNGRQGSTLTIDDLSVTYESSGLPNSGKNTEPEMTLFPNPANEKVSVKNAEKVGVKKLEILDLSGKTKRSIDFGKEKAKGINIQDLPSGTYIYKAKDQKGEILESGKFQITD